MFNLKQRIDMGISMGGLLIKKGNSVSNEKRLDMLGHADAPDRGTTGMEEATSRSFEGIGIVRIDDTIVVLGRDIPYSCALEKGEELSGLDIDLAHLSRAGDIACFLIDSTADTYAYSIFSGGERIRVNSVSGGQDLFDYGSATEYDQGLEATQTGLVRLIRNFTGHSLVEMMDDMDLNVQLY